MGYTPAELRILILGHWVVKRPRWVMALEEEITDNAQFAYPLVWGLHER